MTWRGGENQVFLLAQGLKNLGENNYFSYPENSMALSKLNFGASLALSKKWLPLNSSLHKLKDFVIKNEIQIVHAHSSGAHSLALKLKKINPDIKLIVHRRVAFKLKSLDWSQNKYLSPLVDAYISVSDSVKKTLIQRGVSEDKIFVIPDAVLTSQMNCKSKEACRDLNIKEFSNRGFQLESDTLIVATASAFTKEKGLEIFIESLNNLDGDPDLPPFAVLMAGDGNLQQKIKINLEDKKLKIPWVMTGFHQDIPSFLSGIDIFVMPSLHEGLGSVALEALAAQCCVISSDAGGLKDFIIENETGLLFSTGNIQALTQQLRKALHSEELRKRLGKKGLSIVEKNYSLDSMINGCLSVYKRVLRK